MNISDIIKPGVHFSYFLSNIYSIKNINDGMVHYELLSSNGGGLFSLTGGGISSIGEVLSWFHLGNCLLYNPNFRIKDDTPLGRKAVFRSCGSFGDLTVVEYSGMVGVHYSFEGSLFTKEGTWIKLGKNMLDIAKNSLFCWEDEICGGIQTSNSIDTSRLEQVKEILYDHYAVLGEKKLDKPALMQYHEEYKALTGKEYLKF